jgi:hypothetical protein
MSEKSQKEHSKAMMESEWVPKKSRPDNQIIVKWIPKVRVRQMKEVEGHCGNQSLVEQCRQQIEMTTNMEIELGGIMENEMQKASQKMVEPISLEPQKIYLGFTLTTSEKDVTFELKIQGKVQSVFHITASLISADRWLKSSFSWLKEFNTDKTANRPLVEMTSSVLVL